MNKLSNRRQAVTRVTNGSGVRIPDWQATVMRLNDKTGDELSLGCKQILYGRSIHRCEKVSGQKGDSCYSGRRLARRHFSADTCQTRGNSHV